MIDIKTSGEVEINENVCYVAQIVKLARSRKKHFLCFDRIAKFGGKGRRILKLVLLQLGKRLSFNRRQTLEAGNHQLSVSTCNDLHTSISTNASFYNGVKLIR